MTVMGQKDFNGESPKNQEQKCLCILVMDVSGSMHGPSLNALNEGIQSFFSEIQNGDEGVSKKLKDQIEISLIKYDQDVDIIRAPKLLETGEHAPVLSDRGAITNTVAALREAIKLVNDRKAFYKATGQTYFRPWIILMTDGEPYPYVESDVNEIGQIVKNDVLNKQYMIVGLGVGAANMSILKKMTYSEGYDENQPHGITLPLQGTKFEAFFRWLSCSMSTISQSREGKRVDISKGIKDFAGYQI